MLENTDMLIFWLVVLSRFFVPLLIPRFPLPGVVLALIIDGIDQTIFQKFTTLNLDSYQSYDKALDIYYLTITYLSTMRNWTNQFAFRVGRFLWYYRLVGVVLFELLQIRALLLIFPNTFEYFFIFYEAVRLRWNPKKLTKKTIVYATAFIWIFIKLPQEYWIHIAQLDTTDFLKENVFHVPLDAGLAEILQTNMWLIPTTVVFILALVFGAKWLAKKLPSADWALSVDANTHTEQTTQAPPPAPAKEKFFGPALVEKVALVSLVSIIFAQILPGVQATLTQMVIGVAFVIILTAGLSQFLVSRGVNVKFGLLGFLIMAFVNFKLVLLYSILLPGFEGSLNLTNALFFVLLLTLIVVLFDKYRPMYLARFAT